MPLPRPCLDCGELVARGSRCRRCSNAKRRTTPGRGSASEQARFRAETFATHGRRCLLCGSTEDVEAHHVIGLREGGSNDGEVNGCPLCRRCHRRLEAPASRWTTG